MRESPVCPEAILDKATAIPTNPMIKDVATVPTRVPIRNMVSSSRSSRPRTRVRRSNRGYVPRGKPTDNLQNEIAVDGLRPSGSTPTTGISTNSPVRCARARHRSGAASRICLLCWELESTATQEIARALQSRHDRRQRYLQQFGNFFVTHSLNSDEQENFALLGSQLAELRQQLR